MDLIIGLFVLLIVLGVVFWGAKALCAAWGVPPPIAVTVQVLLVFVAMLAVLSLFGLLPTESFNLRR
jgi:hypothetical protein